MPRTTTEPRGGDEITAEFTAGILGLAEADVAGGGVSAEVEVCAGALDGEFELEDVHPAAEIKTRVATIGSTR